MKVRKPLPVLGGSYHYLSSWCCVPLEYPAPCSGDGIWEILACFSMAISVLELVEWEGDTGPLGIYTWWYYF